MEELSALYILSPAQLNHFFEYREDHGKLLSLYELQAIPGFDLATIRDLLPFVTVEETADPRPLVTRIRDEENNYLILRYTRSLQSQEGFEREDGSGYLGDRNTLYGRYRVSHPNDFSLGLTFEKDAGESFAIRPASHQYGFDYYSAHFLLENKGRLKRLALGDYQLQFGQGLVLGSGFSAGKGAETTNAVKRNSIGVRPYASSLESGFFRGTAATVKFGRLETTGFVSSVKQDANLINDSTYSDFEEFVNSIQATGFHRTQSEVSAKNQLTEISTGIVLHYPLSHRISIGGTGLINRFSKPIQKKPNNYNQFEFSGHQNALSSIYANYNWQNFLFFGEAGISASGGLGAIGGFISSFSPTVDFSFLIRHYDQNFHSFYGNSFGENTRNINERGMYWGLKFHPHRRILLAVYFDKFRFPWLKYRVDAPSEGFEYLVRITYAPSRSFQLYAQYIVSHKELTVSESTANLSILEAIVKRNYLFNADYKLGRHFSMRTRVQGSAFRLRQEQTNGFALVQDLNVSWRKWKLSTRMALFETDDYENRQYVYEKNVLYSFSIPAYFGTGTRSYLLLQYRASQSITLWLRFAGFKYSEQETIGSGLNQIRGNKRTELKAMIRYRFM